MQPNEPTEGKPTRTVYVRAAQPTCGLRDINQLAREVHATAREKGWWDRPRGESLVLLLILTEFAELAEDHRAGIPWDREWEDEAGKPQGPPTEMADIVIRIADWCVHLDITLSLTAVGTEECAAQDVDDYVTDRLARAGACCCDVLSTASRQVTREKYSLAMAYVFDAADRVGVDLWAAIDRKHRYNQTRPYRHGNKQA